MLQKLSHVTIWVLEQDRAKDFYVDTLGFEVRTDHTLGGFRWLTVGPKGQPEVEMILMPVAPGPMLDEATCATLRELVKKGALGVGIFETDDCQATFDELKAKGVEFRGAPVQRPYGIEALMKDDSGNWFSMVQRPR